jgi:nicotinate-nucleotide adenylyltransferase
VKIACFGGSFNPVHIGHVKLVEAVYKAGFDKVIVIPAYHSPFKEAFQNTTDQDRLNMLELAFKNHSYVDIETCELQRGGISYTYDTIKYLEEKLKSQGLEFGKLSLVIGSDLIQGFERWKNADRLSKNKAFPVRLQQFPDIPVRFLPDTAGPAAAVRRHARSGHLKVLRRFSAHFYPLS